ncbi:MAG: response regulator [Rhizobiales bacterium]|nr:response regulator [Hyphomicrobiales bacterium]
MTDLAGSGRPLTGIRVLLVEDETLVAMLLEDMIADLGGTVIASASRVSRALEVVQDNGICVDLAVLDVNLGGEEAFPVAVALAKRGVPFAFSTGYGSSGLPESWRSRPTLQKPFTQDQVSSVLCLALQQTPAGTVRQGN